MAGRKADLVRNVGFTSGGAPRSFGRTHRDAHTHGTRRHKLVDDFLVISGSRMGGITE